jgi:hypothetical protein
VTSVFSQLRTSDRIREPVRYEGPEMRRMLGNARCNVNARRGFSTLVSNDHTAGLGIALGFVEKTNKVLKMTYFLREY